MADMEQLFFEKVINNFFASGLSILTELLNTQFNLSILRFTVCKHWINF